MICFYVKYIYKRLRSKQTKKNVLLYAVLQTSPLGMLLLRKRNIIEYTLPEISSELDKIWAL